MATLTYATGDKSFTLPEEERHEFLVTYEGPAHPSASIARSSANNRHTFCITLPPSGADPCSGSSSSHVSKDDLLSSISSKIGWPPSLLCIVQRDNNTNDHECHNHLLFPSHSLQNNATTTITHHQHAPLTIQIAPRHTRLLGGKGGFGTLLKGQSKQAGARTTLDFGACRDLSGRRLRHVNDEIKLRKWKELQAQRAKAAESGGQVDELGGLKTPSGIRNWHLMVPGWSEGAAFSNKGRRKIERQLQREVRGWETKEERGRMAKQQGRLEEEWAVMEYVRRGEVEGKRVGGNTEDVKEGILAHLRKRKQEKKDLESELQAEGGTKSALVASEKSGSFLDDAPAESVLASHLMTLSGEMSVFDVPSDDVSNKGPTEGQPKKLRLQSQSDFATAVVLLNSIKLKEMTSSSSKKEGVYVEYTIQTAGLAQIGWIRSPEHGGGSVFLPNSDTGDGVGDDSSSFGYDGSRGLGFHNGKEVAYGGCTATKKSGKEKTPVEWKAGDVLGCWCRRVNTEDESAMIEIGYSLNGADLGTAFTVPTTSDVFTYYPAVSLNLNEVVDVNVGPDFAFDLKDGCVGACELVKTEADDSPDGDEGVPKDADGSSKPNVEGNANNDDENAPPRKRPREEPTGKSASNEKEETSKGDSSNQAGEKETFDLDKCSSVDELKEMGPDRLKNILLSMGIKCGGTPEDRAKRLFSLKGLQREEYPNKVRGKNFIA